MATVYKILAISIGTDVIDINSPNKMNAAEMMGLINNLNF